MMNIKPKSCKVCRKKYKPWSTTQQVCSMPCSIILGNRQKAAKAKQQRKADNLKRKQMKKKPWYTKRAQDAMNAYARERDHDLPCISCGAEYAHTALGGTYDGGHYRSVGSSKGTRFLLKNINKQCKHCNKVLDGNPIGYRKGLIKKIGVKAVEAIENDHTERIYTKEQLDRMARIFRKKTRMYKKRRTA